MTIDEAIAVLGLIEDECDSLSLPGRVEALKLGIEALKALKENRIAALPWTEELLPGETEK